MKPSLKHTIYTEQGRIEIRLNDECGNRHADFAITFSSNDMSGCCHEEILRLRPKLKPFVDLHLSDSFGRPLYSVANGFYHLWAGDKTKKERLATAKSYLRVTHAELKELAKVEDKDYFQHTLERLGVVHRWKVEADKAIKQLESLVGEKWDHEYKWERTNYERLPADRVAKMKRRIASGYYSAERVNQRRLKAEEQSHVAAIREVRKDAQKATEKLKRKVTVKLWLLEKIHRLKKRHPDLTMTAANSIYYDHCNQITFNWSGSGAGRQVTLPEFKWFCSKITERDFHTLPSGVSFTIKIGDKETAFTHA